MTRTVALVVGARPNFMKAAPCLRALGALRGVRPLLVHTGQHHDAAMSDAFFADLDLPRPDVSLGVAGGGQADQTARLLVALERALSEIAPALVAVVGDVNSTLAGALAAAKLGRPVAHVEAGLRSGDRRMPEEVNRVATDALSSILYTTTSDAADTLLAEGHAPPSVRFVGNVMIDSLQDALPRARMRRAVEEHGLTPRGYALLTLHRPANVDDPATLARLLDAARGALAGVPLVFPAHPRTRATIERSGAAARDGLRVLAPLGYLDFLRLLDDARLVVTDSGGVQEEATVLGVPCVTLRDTTERPITVTAGTNRLAGTDPDRIARAVREALAAAVAREAGEPAPPAPPLWDGRAAERIAADLAARWTL